MASNGTAEVKATGIVVLDRYTPGAEDAPPFELNQPRGLCGYWDEETESDVILISEQKNHRISMFNLKTKKASVLFGGIEHEPFRYNAGAFWHRNSNGIYAVDGSAVYKVTPHVLKSHVLSKITASGYGGHLLPPLWNIVCEYCTAAATCVTIAGKGPPSIFNAWNTAFDLKFRQFFNFPYSALGTADGTTLYVSDMNVSLIKKIILTCSGDEGDVDANSDPVVECIGDAKEDNRAGKKNDCSFDRPAGLIWARDPRKYKDEEVMYIACKGALMSYNVITEDANHIVSLSLSDTHTFGLVLTASPAGGVICRSGDYGFVLIDPYLQTQRPISVDIPGTSKKESAMRNISNPDGMTVVNKQLYVSEFDTHSIVRIDLPNHIELLGVYDSLSSK